MAHTPETRANVRRMYVEGMALTAAAACANVSYDTAREWKRLGKERGDDWDTARAAYRVSEQGIDELNKNMIEDFARMVLTTTRELDNSLIPAQDKAGVLAQLADAHAKFAKSFSRINPQFSGLSVALDVLKMIVDLLQKCDPQALRALQPHLEAIGAALGKRYG
ncbi:DUF1804 family protein [Methylomonas sp. MS20]|uniref:DUF1804 family protein n=1 Tax=unclassified Methylomonas TaxID=2608980 RepID=UPI0028A554BC|nr:DUF1804 family protein [Methylomonas sp. MV1]MDT4328503.1 DUF1804 family protein [Methylomonas sp. MV1]